MVPSLEGPEGFLGLRGPRRPVLGPLPPWWGSCLSREPGEGAPELQGEQKGIMVARMRARQSATSLLGAQARAGVRPEVERQRERQTEREREEGGRDVDVEEAKRETEEGTAQHSVSVQPADVTTEQREHLDQVQLKSSFFTFHQFSLYASSFSFVNFGDDHEPVQEC